MRAQRISGGDTRRRGGEAATSASAHARHCATRRRAAPWWTRAAVNCVTKAHSSPNVTPMKTFAPCVPTKWKSVKRHNFHAVRAYQFEL